MSSKSLPGSFKQNYKYHLNNSSTISTRGKSFSGSSNDSDIVKEEIHNNSCSLSSSVKKSSPLTKPWFNPETILINDSSTTSNKSWMSRRWSTVSGSLIVRRKHKKSTATRLWLNRQKRRTYPPSADILKQEQKIFSISSNGIPNFNKNPSTSSNRQSLADILTTFYQHNNSSSLVSPTSSSSLSKRISKILKRKGKQPYRKPQLHVDTHYTEEKLKSAVMSMFQPPPTISSQSSTPSSPLKFPTPPKRFSAFYVDLTGKKGKVDYKRPKSSNSRSQYFLNLILRGVPHKLDAEMQSPSITDNGLDDKETNYIDQQQQPYCIKKYNTQLSIDATLFLFGFIFFPFWWVGAYLHFQRHCSSRRKDEEEVVEEKLYFYDNDLFSIHTFAYLNSIFSFMSLFLIIIIIALIIWLVKSNN